MIRTFTVSPAFWEEIYCAYCDDDDGSSIGRESFVIDWTSSSFHGRATSQRVTVTLSELAVRFFVGTVLPVMLMIWRDESASGFTRTGNRLARELAS